MTVSLNDLVFVAMALVIVVAATGVVMLKNIVHSALSLILAFVGVAGIYFQLSAGFIGLVQIMVYAGAISVLIIFAIMLVMDKSVEKTNLFSPNIIRLLAGMGLTFLLFVTLGVAIWFTKFPVVSAEGPVDAVGMLANLFMGDYVIAFETAAILLLVAVIGAIILAKGAEDKQ